METQGQMGPCKEAATCTGTGIRPGQPPHTSQAPGPEREVTQEQSQPWRVTAGCCVCRGFATPPSLPPSAALDIVSGNAGDSCDGCIIPGDRGAGLSSGSLVPKAREGETDPKCASLMKRNGLGGWAVPGPAGPTCSRGMLRLLHITVCVSW